MDDNEQFSQLRNVISTTASALLGIENLDKSILSSNSRYKKILSETIKNLGGDDSLVKLRKNFSNLKRQEESHDAYERYSGDDYFRNQLTDSRTTFRVLTYLSDEILKASLDDEKSNHDQGLLEFTNEEESGTKNTSSLFQGFEASLPILNERLENNDKNKYIKNSEGNDHNNNNDNNDDKNDKLFEFTNNYISSVSIDTEKISRSYSMKYLKTLSEDVLRKLNFTLIQEDVTKEEVEDLSIKLERLKERHQSACKRLETVEQDELFLENALSLIKDRMKFIQEYDLELESNDPEIEDINQNEKSYNEAKESNDLNTSQQNVEDLKPNTFVNNDKDVTVAKSEAIVSKVKTKNQKTINRLQRFYNEENRKSRKLPTTLLQSHYEPGTNIATIEKAHENGVYCMDFDMPFGTLCTAGYLDHTVNVWDLTRKVKVAEMSGHLATIQCMQLGSHYNMLITGGKDAMLKIWDINLATQLYQEDQSSIESDYNSCIHTFDSHSGGITALSFDSVHLVSASQDKTIRQWDLVNGKCIQTIDLSSVVKQNQTDIVNIPDFYSSSEPFVTGSLQCFDAALATGTRDGLVRLWDMRSGKVVRTFMGHTNAVTSLKFDSYNLISGSLDKSIRTWDLRTGSLSDLFAYDSPVYSIDFDSSNLVSAIGETSFKVYNRKDDKQWECVNSAEDTSSIYHVKYKNNYAVTGSNDGTIKAWVV
ncbi:hypothetical protein Kpol_1031p36 [Vanderwaltozyma polyspora DSM 70294]|uniref:Mitochondrial division protein 1 n=1 Tax=Vanderwaltozyma polyspora (strain ATCC 22028 / DSM 70294 / BCRC 21397 / CBS 2163 / NBRC 10782 / NRRL Y-8283 / UCD 57-17) TaxID=436907 RepID=MDV1_VANPO|nr:uncharacterized protein Kpol_1031p36 [Vanderwaltozyma polyspora DSM 70294]A7THX0.1 RecName: Full=Mitochondrial division protein 1 [Vanderwaltozyma polyspora DSM 70294]EDO18132.1 hypothetical protein Kpol_1031p36 [Vanderwaltozyma polyspora DSM 70294]